MAFLTGHWSDESKQQYIDEYESQKEANAGPKIENLKNDLNEKIKLLQDLNNELNGYLEKQRLPYHQVGPTTKIKNTSEFAIEEAKKNIIDCDNVQNDPNITPFYISNADLLKKLCSLI
jgi:predicted RNase H-like nuclease (RuvC/YqgF family)